MTLARSRYYDDATRRIGQNDVYDLVELPRIREGRATKLADFHFSRGSTNDTFCILYQKSGMMAERTLAPLAFCQGMARRRKKKSRQRPTLARASPALPSAMEPLTSVFGMGTGVTAPLWPPAKNRKLGTKETYNSSREREDLTSSEVRNIS